MQTLKVWRALRMQRQPRRQRSLWLSPIARRILALNILALVIPVVGFLYLDDYRNSLIRAEIELLMAEGKLFSGAIAASGVAVDPLGEEMLLPEMTRQTIRRLVDVSKARARLFTPDGALIADSFLISGPGGLLEVTPLPPPAEKNGIAWRVATYLYDLVMAWLPGGKTLPPYKEETLQSAHDYEEVEDALAGESASAVRDAGNGRLVLSAAIPVQRYRHVLGVLLLSKTNESIGSTLRDTRLKILGIFAIALSITVLLSLYLSRTIALPIHQLAEAADRVRHSQGRKAAIPDFSQRGDEIGDLSIALKDMTEAVWKRMDAIERFAADVSHEIKNPLTSLRSAVETVARVDDPVQQRKLMSIILDDVQRLNRLISDISEASRVDAEMSRAESSPVNVKQLLLALADIHIATSGTTGKITVDYPTDDNLVVLGKEGRLGQVFRNLLSNAISFSPPEGAIALVARRKGRNIQITIDDQGPGIPEDRLHAIFERFYTERPKGEKFGTHSGLGLSISKQIIEAHDGTLTASNLRNGDGRIIGARFTIVLPAA